MFSPILGDIPRRDSSCRSFQGNNWGCRNTSLRFLDYERTYQTLLQHLATLQCYTGATGPMGTAPLACILLTVPPQLSSQRQETPDTTLDKGAKPLNIQAAHSGRRWCIVLNHHLTRNIFMSVSLVDIE